MKTPDFLIKNAKVSSKSIHPRLRICLVIYIYYQRSLNILLNKNESEIWELPVGFMYSNEDMARSAQRIAKECTGIKLRYLQQFYVFADISNNIENTIQERYVRVGYNAFMKFSEMQYSMTDNPQLSVFPINK